MAVSTKHTELHQLYRDYVVPALKAGGFTRKGNFGMEKQTADDLWTYVRMRPFTPIPVRTFHLEWAVIPAILREYAKELWPNKNADPLETAIVSEDMEVPVDLRVMEENHHTWAWDPYGKFHPRLTREQFGARLADYLRTVGLPLWRRYSDRDVVAAHPTHGFSYYQGTVYPQVVQLLLYLDHTDPAESRELLDQLRVSDWPYPRLLAFLDERVGQVRRT